MKILHVITTLNFGGAERLMVDLLPLLRDAGHDVELLMFNGASSEFKQELLRKGVRIHELSPGGRFYNVFGGFYNPLNIIKIRRYFRDYDVIHTHNTACQLYVPISKIVFHKSTRLFTTEHNTINRRRSIKFFKYIDKWMYSKYSAVVCISEQTSINLRKYIKGLKNICVIQNGIDVKKFTHPVADISQKKTYTVLMVASFRKQKDHETLLRAMSRLPLNYRLKLVGQDFMEKVPLLKNMCETLGIEDRVEFMGARSDVPDIMEASDVMVLSSHWEGFGLAAAEAMASGRPLVASDVGGLRDVVGDAGVLFPQGDDQALAEKIQFLCEHPDEYRETAARCQEKASQYDISVMASKYLDLYQAVNS